MVSVTYFRLFFSSSSCLSCSSSLTVASHKTCSQQVAQTAGLIMDTCTFPDSTGQLRTHGMRMHINAETNMMIWLRGPTDYPEPYCGWKG